MLNFYHLTADIFVQNSFREPATAESISDQPAINRTAETYRRLLQVETSDLSGICHAEVFSGKMLNHCQL